MKTVKAISNGFGQEGRTGIPYYYKAVVKKGSKEQKTVSDFSYYEQKALLSYKK